MPVLLFVLQNVIQPSWTCYKNFKRNALHHWLMQRQSLVTAKEQQDMHTSPVFA
jgi:hypothetical protein